MCETLYLTRNNVSGIWLRGEHVYGDAVMANDGTFVYFVSSIYGVKQREKPSGAFVQVVGLLISGPKIQPLYY